MNKFFSINKLLPLTLIAFATSANPMAEGGNERALAAINEKGISEMKEIRKIFKVQISELNEEIEKLRADNTINRSDKNVRIIALRRRIKNLKRESQNKQDALQDSDMIEMFKLLTDEQRKEWLAAIEMHKTKPGGKKYNLYEITRLNIHKTLVKCGINTISEAVAKTSLNLAREGDDMLYRTGAHVMDFLEEQMSK